MNIGAFLFLRFGQEEIGRAAVGETGLMPEPVFSAFHKVDNRQLNARQQEVYNFHHIAACLAKYGYATYVIRDDWSGGDMFARHMISGEPMTIQIKSRITFDRKYIGKGLWIGFPEQDGQSVFVYPHDGVLNRYLAARQARNLPLEDNLAWERDGIAHWVKPTKELLTILQPYRLDP